MNDLVAVPVDVGMIGIPHPNSGLGDTAEKMIRERIAHTLRIYPRLNHSMLQIGIGTGFPPKLWHPVLERMISEGVVRRHQVRATNPVSRREQTYTVIERAPID